MAALQSIHDTVDDLRKVEVLIRYDQDDDETHVVRERNIPFVKQWIRGPRFNGYYSLNRFYTELAMASRGRWVWLFNDDCQIQGEWVDDLELIPTHGYMVHPAKYQVGASMYDKPAPTTCPIVPNGCWRTVGLSEVPAVTDAHLADALINLGGWKHTWLERLHLVHERYDDAVYYAHRRLV
jgi:hypothetical protein